MPKAKKITVVVKCQCDVCGQVSHVEPGNQHFYCNGIKAVRPLPLAFKDLRHPDPKRKGLWREYLAPVLQSAIPEPMIQSTETPIA